MRSANHYHYPPYWVRQEILRQYPDVENHAKRVGRLLVDWAMENANIIHTIFQTSKRHILMLWRWNDGTMLTWDKSDPHFVQIRNGDKINGHIWLNQGFEMILGWMTLEENLDECQLAEVSERGIWENIGLQLNLYPLEISDEAISRVQQLAPQPTGISLSQSEILQEEEKPRLTETAEESWTTYGVVHNSE